MRGASAFRGQPVLVLLGLLLAWAGLRAAWWQPPLSSPELGPPAFATAALPGSLASPSRAAPVTAAAFGRAAHTPSRTPRVVPQTYPLMAFELRPTPVPLAAHLAPAATVEELPRSNPSRAAIGHSLLLAAGLSGLDLPPALAAYLGASAMPESGIPAAAPLLASLPQHVPLSASRLSGDAWLMMRNDTVAPVSGRPSYGRSQAGAVVRYRLAPSSALAPQAYARASSALAGPLERDLVAGISARLAKRVPLRVAVEARISETSAGTKLRPAAIAVTELLPLELPHRVRAEAYLQGGYVGGSFATAFVDGQGRVERPLGRFGEAEVSAGAGAWGGAQKGAARLDIGPTAAVTFRLGEARGRLAADYRFRLAGNAEPRSGPALTVSAGF